MTQDTFFITQPTVTTKEAADLLGVTVQTVLKREKEGHLTCLYPDSWKQFGSKIYAKEEVEALLNQSSPVGFTTKEAADLLGVVPSTIFTYIKSGKLVARRIERRGKQVYVIEADALEAFQQTYEGGTKRNEKKAFVIKQNDTEILLFQLLVHQDTAKKARVVDLQGNEGTVMTEEERLFPLSTYQERGYELQTYAKRPLITKRGFVSFSFPKPPFVHGIPYRIMHVFYKHIGAANMRVSLVQNTIHVEVKPCLIEMDVLSWKEEIQYLHAHIETGSLVVHAKGLLLKSNQESLTFYAPRTFKQQVSEMAQEDGIGKEEFLYRAVQAYITARHGQS